MILVRLLLFIFLVSSIPAETFAQMEKNAEKGSNNEWVADNTVPKVGIGLKIQQKEGYPWILVREVIPGSPADAAGLKAGDEITRIEGQSFAGKNIRQIARLITGPAGSFVNIQIKRGHRFMTVKVRRETLVASLPSGKQ